MDKEVFQNHLESLLYTFLSPYSRCNYADIEYIMNKQVNFEDNIFILTMRVKMIRDIVTLDADPEIFLEKTLDDIHFIDQSLRFLLSYLQENPRLVEREEFLDHFSELEWNFSQLLQEFLNHKGNISISNIPTIKEKLMAIRNSSTERRKMAETLYPAGEGSGNTPMVTSDELSELLKAF